MRTKHKSTLNVNSSVNSDSGGKIPGWLIALLLLICLFAPYGMFGGGAGTLRIDHLFIPALLVWAILTRKLRVFPLLARYLLAFAAIAVVSTGFNMQYATSSPMAAIKNLDGLLRGPIILLIAASMRPTAKDFQWITRTLVMVIVLFAGMAMVEALAPQSAGSSFLAMIYGGPAYTVGRYGELGVNHKQLMLRMGRASAVYPTAPALGAAALFFFIIALIPTIRMSNLQRTVMCIAAGIAGYLAYSKSFVFGMIVVLSLSRKELFRSRTGLIMMLLTISGFLVAIIRLATLDEMFMGRLFQSIISGEASMSQVTAGRYGGDDWSLWTEAQRVLSESPLIGYGLGQRPDAIYSDSGINRFLMHAGVFGTVVAGWGIIKQLLSFRKCKTSWSKAGERVLIVSILLFAAVPIFMMARLNDILFTVIGLACIKSGSRFLDSGFGDPLPKRRTTRDR